MRRAQFSTRFGTRALAIALGALLVPASARSQTSYPMTLHVAPTAVTRGRAAELVFASKTPHDGAWALLCEGPGLSGTILKGEPKEAPRSQSNARPRRRFERAAARVAARLEVALDAPLGPRELRIATPQGASSIGMVLVVDEPVAIEEDDAANDRAETAQRLALPVVVSGAMARTEDVDWYAFHARKRETVSFEIWAGRIENKIHDLQTHFDPILTLYDSRGRKLAVADNTYAADPLLSWRAVEDGDYFLEVRDTTYSGNPSWRYALRALKGPIATSVFPMAVKAGAEARLEVQGPGFERPQSIVLPISMGLAPGEHWFALASVGGGARPLPLLVVPDRPIVLETTDAPAADDPKASKARPIALPATICGRLEKPDDADGHAFQAKKGRAYAIEVIASRAGSECDPVLRVVDARGKILSEVDDVRGININKDARVDWKAPADGTYFAVVADLHDRGGPAFGYVLNIEEAAPDFALTCDPDKINVGPGGRVPVFIRLERRHGFNKSVAVQLKGLPKGASASALTIAPTMNEGVLVVSAAPKSEHASALVAIEGTGEGPSGPLVRTARPLEEIYLPGGGRGRYPVNTLAAAITDAPDVTVEAKPSEIVLEPGGTATIDVTVARHPRYTKGVNLAVVLRHLGGVYGNPLPPGVTLKDGGGKTLLGPKETRGRIVLQAAADAPPCNKVPIAVMGHVSINFVVKTAYTSAPVLITVRPKK